MPAWLLKSLRTAVYSLLFLAGLLLFAALVLTGTEGGTAFLVRTALDKVEDVTSMQFTVGGIEGTLISDLSLRQLNVHDTQTGLRINAEFLGTTLDILALADSRVHLQRLEARGLVVTLPTSGSEEPSDPETTLSTLFSLPVGIAVDSLEVEGVTVTGEQPLALQSISAALAWDNTRMLVTARVMQDARTWAAPELELAAEGYRLTGGMMWQTVIGEQNLAGSLQVSGTLYTMDIRHELTAPVAVTTDGNLDTGLRAGDVLGFDFAHQATSVGGDAFGVPALENVSGTVTTTGTPASIRLNADADARVNGLGSTTVRFAADYAAAQLAVEALSLVNDRFTFGAAGSVGFSDGLVLDLDWDLADFTDGDLLPQVELAGVNGNGRVRVSSTGDETLTELSLDSLTGSLNGYPLSGNGEILINGSAINNVALTLVSDVNSLRLEGGITPRLDLLWELQAPALTQLLDGLTGEITGSGTLTGTTGAPQVSGTLDAAGLAYQDNEIAFQAGVLNAEASYSGTSNAVKLTYANVSGRFGERDLVQDAGILEFTGSPADHAFSLTTDGPEISLVLEGEGGWSSPAWEGTLANLDLRSPFGDWRLQNPLALALAQDHADIGSHCWLMRGIMVCGEAAWTRDGGLGGNLAVDNVDLAWLNDNLDPQIPGTAEIQAALAERPQGIVDLMDAYRVAMPGNGLVEGMLDMTVEFDGIGLAWNQTTMTAELVPRDVSLGILRPSADDPDAIAIERYGIDDIALNVQRNAGRWQLQNSFEIYLGESGGLDFQGDFSGDFSLADDNTLGGEFSLVFNDIAWVEALAPNLSQVSGELGASGNISGTLQQPLLNMDARLDNGSLRLPEFGLLMQEVGLEFHSVNSNEITITGSAHSGQGSITLDSLLTMPLLDSRTLEISVRGDMFELLNTPETTMAIAPDLALDYREGVLNVSGSIDVPTMHIDYSDRAISAGTDTIDVSRDVVIIAEDGSQRAAESAELLGLIPVTGEVRLGMGDDVSFQGYGLNLRLTGNLELEQSIDRPMLAHGELSIPTGSYELYGQRLTIDNGKLLFLGNPLNPALDIRAVRQTRVAEVGILMNGTARRINAQLFSTPSLPESEVLSLLITGNSFSNGGDAQSGQNMLGAIALLGLEKGQGLTSSVTSKLGIDSVAITNDSDDYRDSAIGLGKYIRPNLFMRYDIGLFDRENVLTLDYILTERLRLEVETGVSQSVDLTYTVEK